MDKDLEEKGRKIRAQLWDAKTLEEIDQSLRQFDEPFANLLNEQLFGAIWTRPGIPLKTRSMITMAALMSLGRWPQLKAHMLGALNLGITPAEVKEVIIHLSQYSGVPTAVEAIRIFNEVTAPKR